MDLDDGRLSRASTFGVDVDTHICAQGTQYLEQLFHADAQGVALNPGDAGLTESEFFCELFLAPSVCQTQRTQMHRELIWCLKQVGHAWIVCSKRHICNICLNKHVWREC